MTISSSYSSTVYQVDCQMTKKGKMFAGSKRRVCWRFGFANREAIEAGQTGTACRGEEHEVVMVWSLTSGKQLVLADGHEVHWSKARTKMFDRFECNWQMACGRELSVIAHASTPLFDKKEGFRQFDLKIDGMSFWDMPQMYELGGNNGGIKSTDDASFHAFQTPIPNLRQVSPVQLDTSIDDQYSVVSDIHASFYRSQPQISASDPGLQPTRSVSPSPSMPDLLDFPSTAPSPMDIAVPLHRNFPSTQGSSSPSSPISVMNPFDIYSSPPAGTHNSKAPFAQQHQQMPYHTNMHHCALSSPRMNDVWSAQQQQQQQQQQQHLYQHQLLHHQPFSSTAAQPYAPQPSVYTG